jgi:hypothetical protein
MSRISGPQLAERLQQQVLRIPTGIVLLANDELGREEEFAARLQGVGEVDLCKWKIEQLTGDVRYLGISETSLIEDLRTIVEAGSIRGNCLWVYNVDVMISRLGSNQRLRFWEHLFSHFHQKRGLMVSLPEAATNLLPVDGRKLWSMEGRLATYEGAVI